MLRRAQLLVCLSLLVFVGLLAGNGFETASADAATWPYVFAHGPYMVQTPPKMQVKQRQMADFDIYTFFLNKRSILSAYVGNNPDFPLFSSEHASSKNSDPVNDLVAQTIVYRHPASGLSRETLVTLKASSQPCCQYIHFFYSNDSRSEAAVADSIIKSLQ
jgi:hypothetical protein